MNWRKEVAQEWKRIRSLRTMAIHFDADKCTGVWECFQVCPVGCWTPDRERRKAIFYDGGRCIACGACVLQCPQSAIKLH